MRTRSVCGGCNARVSRDIDDVLATYLMVNKPKALAGVRSIRHLQDEPVVEAPARISSTGEPVTARFSLGRSEARRADGTLVTEPFEITYGMHPELWSRFIAKVALGCAALSRYRVRWLDTPLAVALRAMLREGRIDSEVWPGGVPALPSELSERHPIRRGLGDDRHLVGIVASPIAPEDDAIAIAALFGGQLFCSLPLPGVKAAGSGTVWVLDWHPNAPPSAEDYHTAVDRLLRERGFSTEAEPEPDPLGADVLAAIDRFASSPVGRQLADPTERRGRCWQASTRFLAALRESGADGHLLVWPRDGDAHGAIQVNGTDTVVDWASPDPEHPFPLILHRDTADTQWGSSHVYEFESPFFRGRGMPEVVLPWAQAQTPIPPST